MRHSLPLLALLLATTAGCSRAVDDGNRIAAAPAERTANVNASDAAEATAVPRELPAPGSRTGPGAAPEIDPQSAPGIAFDFRYSFRLEAGRVAEIQRAHQQLCASYGSRCQVTGVDYRAVNDEDVEAMLSFAVDPEIAAQFGREGVRAVTAAEGELTDSAVSGTDVGSSLKANHGERDDLQAELDRIEARLARRNLPWVERSRLDQQRQSLRQQIAALDTTTDDQEHALATVPILFRYGSGALAPGPGHGPTVGEAAERAANNFLAVLRSILIAFVTLSPWALTGLLAWLGFRALRRRRPGPPAAPAETGPGA